MFDRIRKFFRSLFGGGSADQAVAPTTGPPPSVQAPQSDADPQPAAQAAYPPDAMVLRLVRQQPGPADMVGKLYHDDHIIATTLESPLLALDPSQAAVPAGTYPLSLHQAGGRHSTYLFRLGTQHQGMLMLNKAPGNAPVCFIMGFEALHLYGCIMLGEGLHPPTESTPLRRLQGSETAYLRVYQQVASHLAQDKPAILVIDA
jgi:hypothetical protein